jgi:hypothetical protein
MIKLSSAYQVRFSGGIMFGLFLLFAVSCKHEIPEPIVAEIPVDNGNGNILPCDSDSVYFNMQILPFLVANCAQSGCHDAASHQDGVVITSYQTLMNSGIIEIGDPNNGDLIDVITDTDPGDRMPPPPAPPLTAQQIQLIQTWIAQGAQNLICDNGCDTSNVTYNAVIKPIIQNKCQGCHQGSSPGGGINLSTYLGVQGSAIDGSLLGSIQHQPGWSAMPKNTSKMPDCDIAKIRIWVNAGAPNN